MAVQMTFQKRGKEFTATHGEVVYLVTRLAGGYAAMYKTAEMPRAVALPGAWFYDNRGLAEQACNVHAARA